MVKHVSRGFTLFEMLIVVAVFLILTSIILADNNRFGGRVLVENLAYDVGLSIRKAQVYGISVQRFGTSNYAVGYGMHFDSANPSTYVLFADANGSGLYDPSASEAVETQDLQTSYSIANLCMTPASSGTETCGLTSLNIVFRRPEPDAYISANGNSCIAMASNCGSDGRIILESPRGDQVSVVVESTGQITVQ